MRRHLDDHPSLNSSGGDFNSNSLALSATNTTNSNSRIFHDIDASAEAPNSNIPLTTSITNTTSATVNSTFHSTLTLNAPASPGAGNNHNKPLISSQPLALIQENFHAVGSSSNSEMQSSVQFPLTSGFQAGVAANVEITTLSQGHAQSSSSVHHGLPGQTQTHSYTQIVHPLQQANSQSHVGGTKIKGYQFRKCKLEDTHTYLKQVKNKLRNQPQVYKDYLHILHESKSKRIDRLGLIDRISKLFRDHLELIAGFNDFLPIGYKIQMVPPQWAYQVENFVNKPDEELVCSICRAIFCDPVMCRCDHVFCRACITKWLQSSRNCPICRKRVRLASIKRTVLIIKNLIMKLMLNCHNKNLGCKAQFSVANSMSHMKECEYELVQCKNKPCEDVLFRKDLMEHETRDCPHPRADWPIGR